MTQVFYNGPEEQGKEFFADLFALEPLANMTSMMPYEKLNSLLNHAAGFDGRKAFGGGAFKLPLDAAFVTRLHEDFRKFVDAHERMGESMMLFECVPYGKIMETSNDAMAFSNRGDYYNVATVLKWLVFKYIQKGHIWMFANMNVLGSIQHLTTRFARSRRRC
jgi:hypothetical protein